MTTTYSWDGCSRRRTEQNCLQLKCTLLYAEKNQTGSVDFFILPRQTRHECHLAASMSKLGNRRSSAMSYDLDSEIVPECRATRLSYQRHFPIWNNSQQTLVSALIAATANGDQASGAPAVGAASDCSAVECEK